MAHCISFESQVTLWDGIPSINGAYGMVILLSGELQWSLFHAWIPRVIGNSVLYKQPSSQSRVLFTELRTDCVILLPTGLVLEHIKAFHRSSWSQFCIPSVQGWGQSQDMATLNSKSDQGTRSELFTSSKLSRPAYWKELQTRSQKMRIGTQFSHKLWSP